MSVEIFTSPGNSFCMAESDCSRRSVSSSVLVDGCLVTVTITADLPLSEAIPVLGSLFPTVMSDMSSRHTEDGEPGLTVLRPILYTSDKFNYWCCVFWCYGPVNLS